MSVLMRRLHRWLGLLLAIQVLVWIASGALISLLDSKIASGAVFRAGKAGAVPLSSWGPVVEPSQLDIPVSLLLKLRLDSLQGRPVYRVTTSAGTRLFDARSGRVLEIDRPLAERIARASYAGAGPLAGVSYLAEGEPGVGGGAGPVWRVDFADQLETRVYLSGSDGEVLGHKNRRSRLVDLLLMLHFMDYGQAGNFNNPQIIVLAFGALWLALSGVVLVFTSFSRADFAALPGAGRGVRPAAVRVGSPAHPPATLQLDNRLSLYASLAPQGIRLPSNCEGSGSCGLCRIRYEQDPPVPTGADREWIDRVALAVGERLACQHRPRQGDRLALPDIAYQTDLQGGVVTASRWLTPLLKEIRIRPDEPVAFRPGDYFQFCIPPCQIQSSDLGLPVEFQGSWHEIDLPDRWASTSTRFRAYSVATAPGLEQDLVFTVRFAPPPDGSHGVPPGIGSSYLCSLVAGERVAYRGPSGDFHLADSPREKILIGGGAGMAPLKAMTQHLLETRQWQGRLRFWYGARNQDEILYRDTFEALAARFENFEWGVALSDAADDQQWPGDRGFVHRVVMERVLQQHPALDNCEFYLCGPPLMLEATRHMLGHLGVAETAIRFDDFGS
ncbi:2Fe-2S iron-sulfur cluster binding domain-containing protein [Parahaliea maris]|uniref:2Fe-2S iron-sulfur cluster binding domain-containing protein n=1 Tax=Parahaliea maris TaxID=2716870 RepID=A0A5C9A6P3_9GAMM|nr:PepSY domain-containing protein [Parahaliea maris]TXS95247.1 2Fe-2S iron-sulfur cluster binding domain-containing protein [Parahaliea maris]